jgi:O-methyltransferase
MESGANLIQQIKNLAKRNQLIVRLYRPIKFLEIFSGKNLLNLCRDLRKTRLMLTIMPYTMTDYQALSTLYESGCRFERAQTTGSFVECGVRNGGSAAVMAATTKNNTNRHIWLFDSWEGFPEPGDIDIAYNLKQAEKGGCLGSEETVKELFFGRLKLDSTRVHLVKGWFQDTLPRKEIGPIALLHLHCDLYESVKCCLEQLYNDVINGGCIFIEDYRYYEGSREAVTEFLNRRNLQVELVEYGKFGVYFHKES